MELCHQASPCAKASLIHLFIYGALVGTMRRECLNCVISAEKSSRVDDTLQSGATSRQPRSRDTRANQEATAERCVREAPIARGLPNQNKKHSLRTPS